jgi:hypothetical protein
MFSLWDFRAVRRANFKIEILKEPPKSLKNLPGQLPQVLWNFLEIRRQAFLFLSLAGGGFLGRLRSIHPVQGGSGKYAFLTLVGV